MTAPNSRRHLDTALIRAVGDGAAYLQARSLLANSIVAQMLGAAVIKGGSSLKLRFGDENTRATSDLDIARMNDLEGFLSLFEDALAHGWSGFTGRIVPRQAPHPRGVPEVYVMQPFDIKLSYLGGAWCTVSLELGHNEMGDADVADFVIPQDANCLLERLGFPQLGPVPLMPLHYQIAQKLHALTALGSMRAHDLIDLQVIVNRSDIDLALVRETCRRLFSYRRQQPWPSLIVPIDGWESLYLAQLLPLPVKQSLAEAVDWGNSFIATIEAA